MASLIQCKVQSVLIDHTLWVELCPQLLSVQVLEFPPQYFHLYCCFSLEHSLPIDEEARPSTHGVSLKGSTSGRLPNLLFPFPL